MKNIQVIRTSGVLVSLALGLSSCMMGDGMMWSLQDAPPPPMMHTVPNGSVHSGQANKAAVKSSSTEPAQRKAPGPKRAAAPQIPVM